MQRMIDAGALTVWTEENGLEMCAEFTREVGGETTQKNNLHAERELFFFAISVYMYVSVHVMILSICAYVCSEHMFLSALVCMDVFC